MLLMCRDDYLVLGNQLGVISSGKGYFSHAQHPLAVCGTSSRVVPMTHETVPFHVSMSNGVILSQVFFR